MNEYLTLRVYPNWKNSMVFGTPFLNDYYQVYDNERNQMGLVPSALVNEEDATLINPPYSTDEEFSKDIRLYCSLGFIIVTLILRNCII